jgi:hypothetical protein
MSEIVLILSRRTCTVHCTVSMNCTYIYGLTLDMSNMSDTLMILSSRTFVQYLYLWTYPGLVQHVRHLVDPVQMEVFTAHFTLYSIYINGISMDLSRMSCPAGLVHVSMPMVYMWTLSGLVQHVLSIRTVVLYPYLRCTCTCTVDLPWICPACSAKYCITASISVVHCTVYIQYVDLPCTCPACPVHQNVCIAMTSLWTYP